MNRRGFLGSLIGGVAVASVARTWPFRVFSFPTEITIPEVLPFAGGNQLVTISMITRESLLVLEKNLMFTKMQRSDDYDRLFGSTHKIGTVLNIRKPIFN